MPIDITRGDVRRIMETAFEPHGDGFVYYRSSWSKGVPVTPAERELFAADWTPQKSAEFHRLIAGRAPVTPARGLRPLGAVARALPVGVVSLVAGGALAAASLAWDEAPGALRPALWGLSAFLLLFAAGVFLLRRFRA